MDDLSRVVSTLDRLPVFPLPDAVLFPHMLLPLHVFEPRYRRMVEDCLAGSRVLAVALLKPGWEARYYGQPPFYPVVGAGVIVHEERLPDGRFNIGLKGVVRVAVEEELATDTPYRLVRGRLLPDELPAGGAAALEQELTTLKLCCLRLAADLPEANDDLARFVTRARDPALLVDVIAAIAIPDAHERQRLLETPSVKLRLRRVTQAVGDLILTLDVTR
ncbi:MAG TPA: LON peptidase substrate-binding domain-containing protein, partial [Thermodesulfobacteriota bacterium]|nr:LON peptidase substrate-binding domain-containing protein [Thermodesulfobacteriota bacterium]